MRENGKVATSLGVEGCYNDGEAALPLNTRAPRQEDLIECLKGRPARNLR